MSRSKSGMLIGLLLLGCFLPLSTSHAVMTGFSATDLTDTTVGQDLWQYSYTVSDFNFSAGQGFTIYFDRNLFKDLGDPPPAVNAHWDPIVLQPSLVLPSDGTYDAMALANGASLADPFKVSLVWLGTGTPGSQPFDIYDTDFSVITTGNTVASPVPVPPTIVLFGSGLGALLVSRKRRNAR